VGRVKRRHGQLSTPEVLAAAMPAELLMLEFCSTVEGLRFELGRIKVWLDEQVPGRGSALLPGVLAHIGFEMAVWYRWVLSSS
jgi:hypothetical protein